MTRNRPLAARLASSLGRRGTFLVLYGTMFILYGLSLHSSLARDRPGLELLLAYVPLDWLGWGWLLLGVNAIGHAFRKSPGSDVLGFYGVIAPLAVWAVAYFLSWVSHLIDVSRGTANGGVGALIYLILAATVLIIAGWPEPEGQKPSVLPLAGEGDDAQAGELA